MDYNRLSRESLIHEIEQLNREKERVRLSAIGTEMDLKDCLDDMNIPVFIVNKDFNIAWTNRFGLYNNGELIDQKCYQVLFNRQDVCKHCNLQNAFNDRVPFEYFENGKSYRYIPLIRNDEVNHVLVMAFENAKVNEASITLNEQVQKLTLERDQLKLKYDHLSSFMQDFSKAMKIPLRSFIGYFQMFRETQNAALKDEYLEVLKINSEGLYETLNKFLLFSKVESGELFGRKEPFSVRRLIEETITQVLVPLEISENRHYRLNYTETLPDVLFGDVFKLKLILSYLLELAQFISSGEMLEIRLTDIMQTHSKMVLKLSIQAPNLRAARLKILEPVNNSGLQQFETIEEYSLGLGISMAQKMVASQNGTLELVSGLDDQLYIDMVLTYDKVIPKNELPETFGHKDRKRILIADYDKPMLSLEVFKKFDIYFAHTGNEAISQFAKIDPDLMIINVLIEDCDGFKVFDEIERRRMRLTPIIAISSKLVDNEREFMRDYGFNEYYSKPLDDSKFNHILENYF